MKFKDKVVLVTGGASGLGGATAKRVVELGGKVLGPMVKRIAPDAKVTSVVTIEDIEALAKEIH